MLHQFTFPKSCTRVSFSLSSPARLSNLLDNTHSNMREVVLHCDFHLQFSDSDVAHLFMHPLTICVSSSEKCLCISFAQF